MLRNISTTSALRHGLLLNRSRLPMTSIIIPFLRRAFHKTSTPVRYPQHTKEQLLSQSRHFLDRIKIRFKWMLIRQNRPFNVDEISAFVSWIVMGNLLWFIIGTTTFFSLIFYLFDKFLNDHSSRNKYLLKLIKFDTTNLDFQIDKNFVIEYKDGKIIFSNLKINNFKIQSLSLNLSFQKWHEGKGLIKDLELNGLRGSIITNDFMELSQFFSKNYELENFVIKDSLIDMNGVKLQIFHCQLDKLRNNWLVYDFFNSDNCTGAINDALFTIHTKQQLNRNYASFEELEKINLRNEVNNTSFFQDIMDALLKKPVNLETFPQDYYKEELQQDSFKKIIRFRIDELELENLPKPTNFAWVDTGKMELIADIMFPEEETVNYETRINQELKSIISGLYEKLTNTKRQNNDQLNEDNEIMTQQRKYVMIDLKLQFKDLKLKFPSFHQIDPELIKFINNYNSRDQNYELTSSELDVLVNDDSIFNMDHHYFDNSTNDISSNDTNLPPINFRIIENIQFLTISKLQNTIYHELILQLMHLKLENDMKIKSYKDSSFLIKNLIMVGLGVCLI